MAKFSGKQISQYQIGELIGQGGMADVYHAHDRQFDREVAIKFIKPDALNDEDGAYVLARFRREIQAMKSLNHLSIIRLTGCCL